MVSNYKNLILFLTSFYILLTHIQFRCHLLKVQYYLLFQSTTINLEQNLCGCVKTTEFNKILLQFSRTRNNLTERFH